jgi:hypothetical protein
MRESLTRKKLLGVLLGTAAGCPVGWFVAHYAYPWGQGIPVYHLFAGALAGAVVGSIIPGWTLGRLGWGIVTGTGCGAILGLFTFPSYEPGALVGALLGFVAGLFAGLTAPYPPPSADVPSPRPE